MDAERRLRPTIPADPKPDASRPAAGGGDSKRMILAAVAAFFLLKERGQINIALQPPGGHGFRRRLDPPGRGDHQPASRRRFPSSRSPRLRDTAEQGNAEAQSRLGEFREKGEAGLAKSEVEAAKWFKLAAAQGHEEALKKLSN